MKSNKNIPKYMKWEWGRSLARVEKVEERKTIRTKGERG